MNPVFATKGGPSVSDTRYTFVSSNEILQMAESHDLSLVSAKVQRVRNPKRIGYEKHLMSFALDRGSFPGDARPEVSIINSHDGQCGIKVFLGITRFICLNGLFVGTSLGSYNIRHSHKEAREITQSALRLAISKLPKVTTQVSQWQNTLVSPTAKLIYLTQVLDACKAHGINTKGLTLDNLQDSRRIEDTGNTLWILFNRSQEHIIRGGQSYVTSNGRHVRRRQLSAIDTTVEINRALWDITEKFHGWLQGTQG